MIEKEQIMKKRLLYVKTLFEHGREHVYQDTEFDRMIAIHHFDNAVELLLKFVATHYDITFKNPLNIKFPDLWNQVNKKYKEETQSELPKKTEIFQLHKFRSDVQHWGISEFSLEIVNKFEVYAIDFIKEILSSVFNIDYNSLYLGSLVSDPNLRELVITSEEKFNEKKWKESIHKIAVAFAFAKNQALKKLGLFSPFWHLSGSRINEFEEIRGSIADLKKAVEVLALNVDFEKYSEFRDKTPAVLIFSNKDFNYQIQEIRTIDYNEENAQFCLNFVTNLMLRWKL